MLEKINVEDIKPSSRKYPGIIFTQGREAGKQILSVNNLSYVNKEGEALFKGVSFNVEKGDKVAVIGDNSLATTAFHQILNGELDATTGDFEFGQTITTAYLPNDNEEFFDGTESLMDWLRQYSENKDEMFIRGFLGKMLFSGEEVLKKSDVLSGGEKVRCMLSRMMMASANVLMLDEPTNHLDLETIEALNNSMKTFTGTLMFTSRDHTFTETVANRIVELTPKGFIDSLKSFDEYIVDGGIADQKKALS